MIDAVPKAASSSASPLECMGSGCCMALGLPSGRDEPLFCSR